MKFKFNGDVYQVHPVAVKVMQAVFVLAVLYASYVSGFLTLLIAILITLFVIAVVFSDGNIQLYDISTMTLL